MKKTIRRYLRKIGSAMTPTDFQDLSKERLRLATRTTAEYIEDHLPDVQSVSTTFGVHDRAIERAMISDGLVLEFGVFSGNSINYIASKRPWTVDGFDSFEGLPESWRDGFQAGHFSVDALPPVASNVRLHKGWFDRTIPIYLDSLADRRQPIAYLHVDCDLYSSTKTVFNTLSANIVPGTVIVFDEYFNYPGWKHGEFLAFREFVADRGINYDYITYNNKHEQAAVIIK